MKARTLISHGCQGFLASVMDISLESPNIENLSVYGTVELKELKEQLLECWRLALLDPSVPTLGVAQPVHICYEEGWEHALIDFAILGSSTSCEKQDISKTAFPYALWPLRILSYAFVGIIRNHQGLKAITKLTWDPCPTNGDEDDEKGFLVFKIYSDASKKYHPGKANVVADALSRKSGMIACFDSMILLDLERLDVELCVRGSGGYWASMRIESNLMLQIKEAQRDDGELWAIV
ncbi:hypothetical protein Tco_0968439 [Tanacetum coccineum]